MGSFIVFFLWSTFGLPLMGVIILFVAVMVSGAIYVRNKQGHSPEATYPKMLYMVGLGLIVVPLIYFLLFVVGKGGST